MTQITHPTTGAATASPTPPPKPVDILILGAGWSSKFLLPLLTQHDLTHAATTRTGHDSTIPFTFTPDSTSEDPYARLPSAKTVLITFPLKGTGQSETLTSLYARTHEDVATTTRWVQLGSTGIFTAPHWNDDASPHAGDDPYTPGAANQRAVAEDELLALRGAGACVLNLAGLYGGERQPRNWIARVAKSKGDVKGKGALHLVHGNDVARAVVGVVGRFEAVGGKRWIVTDLRVYDWWDLIMSWGGQGTGTVEGMEYQRWVVELIKEEGVRALPREKEALGRVLDGRGFWEAIGSWPGEGRVA